MDEKPLPFQVWEEDCTSKIVPAPFDILCGRGKTAFMWEGNAWLREVIACHLREFLEAGNRIHKTNIVRRIIQAVLNRGGRFLKKDVKGSDWYLAGFKAAREKVSHALRDASTFKVKCMIPCNPRHIQAMARQKIQIKGPKSSSTSSCSRVGKKSLVLVRSKINDMNTMERAPDIVESLSNFHTSAESEYCYPDFNMDIEGPIEENCLLSDCRDSSLTSDIIDLYNELELDEVGTGYEEFSKADLCLDDFLFRAIMVTDEE
jgi:hypothetical protein